MPTTFTIRPATPADIAPARALMIRTFEEDFGFDELFLDPTTNDLTEVDRAADAVL